MSLLHLISEQVVLAIANAAPRWVFVDRDHWHCDLSFTHPGIGTRVSKRPLCLERQAKRGERNYQSFETAVGGLKHRSSRMTLHNIIAIVNPMLDKIQMHFILMTPIFEGNVHFKTGKHS